MLLRSYQSEAIAYLDANQRALLALPPGAGKTAIVSSWAPRRTLIVAPNGPVLRHWQSELFFWGEGVPSGIATGSASKRGFTRFNNDVVITNYECMRNDIEDLLEYNYDCVVFDESHRLKGRKVTFKAAATLAKQTPKLVLVTGTPILNRADELWASLHLIDPKKYRSYWRWVENHFHIDVRRLGGRMVRQVGGVREGHVEIIKGQLAQVMFHRNLRDILPDLPPTVETTYEIELSAAERKAHDSMAADFWMEVGDDIVAAENAVAKHTRLRQLCSDWSVFGEPPGAKALAAAQLVEDLDGEQCVIFCAFRATADAVAALLPNARAYHGGKSGIDRMATLDNFKTGHTQVVVATIATMGEGVDGLQVCRNVIMLDRHWTPARNEQAIDRVGGARATRQVNVTHIVAKDSMDDVVATALAHKLDVIEAIIETKGKLYAVRG